MSAPRHSRSREFASPTQTPDVRLLALAAAVSDGHTVDWSAIESSGADEERALLPCFRALAALAATAHSSDTLIGDVDGPASSDAAVSHHEPPRRWGELEIRERIGGGRFGIVYRAWDRALEREVALKLLRRSGTTESESSPVVNEGRLMARVRHPNVAAIFGAQRIGGCTGLWMEFVDGRTLEAERRSHGAYAPEEIAAIGLSLSAALSAVHTADLVHRDVKAQNVLREKSGRIVLGDFGTGYEMDAPASPRTVAGTPLYLAPEIFAGAPPSSQSDLYSLGVLLFLLATGRYPVSGDTGAAIGDAHRRGGRLRLIECRPEFPPALAVLIERALDPDPRNRGTASAFGAALSALQPGRRRSPWRDSDPHGTRRRLHGRSRRLLASPPLTRRVHGDRLRGCRTSGAASGGRQ